MMGTFCEFEDDAVFPRSVETVFVALCLWLLEEVDVDDGSRIHDDDGDHDEDDDRVLDKVVETVNLPL